MTIEPLLGDWPGAARHLSAWGYAANANANANAKANAKANAEADAEADARTVAEARRFLRDWSDCQRALYVTLSLPPACRHPADAANPVAGAGQTMLEKAVPPVCAERGLPLAMMIGATRGANPALNDAGDRGAPITLSVH